MADRITDIADQLSNQISDEVGNMHETELETISKSFDKTLSDALKSFNSDVFDDDGFIKKMRDLDVGDSRDKNTVKSVLNDIRSDYINVESINHSELLMKRDLNNICTQMPEMRDVVYVVRDSIIECNVSTGEVSRQLTFGNHESDDASESQVKDIEIKHDLLMAIKNYIVPNTLKNGEMYIHVVPYAKLFAEIEKLKESRYVRGSSRSHSSVFKESIPNTVYESFSEHVSLYSEDNVELLMESVLPITKIDGAATYRIENNNEMKADITAEDKIAKDNIKLLLESIDVYNGSSELMTEMGFAGFRSFVSAEYNDYLRRTTNNQYSTLSHFSEAMSQNYNTDDGIFGNIDQDDVDTKTYNDIKGCYIKYLDPLRIVPIRMDRRVIGYYYVTTTMDLQNHPAQPNGMIDLSFQNYTRDKNMVNNLANMIIKSFDKQMLEKNVKLKNEIAEIIMAHKFSEGKLSFIYIPENEVIRLIINEDENGKGHSILEPTMFPARMYLMLTMYNMLYTLNNNTTRIHYLKSSGLNKDYSSQIQRAMRKFQSRRITIDDIYSFSGVLNKIGGMGEMILPAGRNGDFKAFETDTIESVNNPISTEFLEQQRRQAISGTGVPHLLVINAIDEVDFAKTLEMANTRFLSTVSGYKIDFNKGFTKLYQMLMKHETDLDPDLIQSFRFKFNPAKQQDLNITADMIQVFNSLVELTMAIYYRKDEMEDEKGNATPKQMILRKELAKKYIGQLDFDELDELIDRVNIEANDIELQDKVKSLSISDEDIKEIDSKE